MKRLALVLAVIGLLAGAGPVWAVEGGPAMRAARVHAWITRAEAIAIMGQEPVANENQRLGNFLDIETLYFHAAEAETVEIRLMFNRVIAVKVRQGAVPQ